MISPSGCLEEHDHENPAAGNGWRGFDRFVTEHEECFITRKTSSVSVVRLRSAEQRYGLGEPGLKNISLRG